MGYEPAPIDKAPNNAAVSYLIIASTTQNVKQGATEKRIDLASAFQQIDTVPPAAGSVLNLPQHGSALECKSARQSYYENASRTVQTLGAGLFEKHVVRWS